MRTQSGGSFLFFRSGLVLGLPVAVLMPVILTMVTALPAAAQAPAVPGMSSAPASDQPQSSPPPISPPLLSSDPFSGSVMVDRLVPGTLQLSLLDVINRGQKHNLGLLLSQEQTGTARAGRWRSLSALLPNVSAHSSETVQRINLAAFGIPFTVNGATVVGPFGIFDARPSASQRLLDMSAYSRLRSSAENEKAARFNVQDARELVVLAVGNQYLLVLADAARLATAQAQLATAQAVLRQAQDMKNAGAAAGIDVLRAQVQMQQQRQRVLAAGNQLEQQKMMLARAIGLPVTQPFELTDTVPYAPLEPLDMEREIALAYTRRPEYLAAESRVRAAELSLKAARQERLPTLDVEGDYGALGRSPGASVATYTAAAGVRVPVFQGGRVRADILDAQTVFNQFKMQLEDLRERIEFEARSAALDVKTSDDQVAVATQSIALAGDQLKQSQDRYSAGVTDNLEVVQSQESVAAANETYIQALYQNNVAKLALARALGVAEQRTRAFLEGRK